MKLMGWNGEAWPGLHCIYASDMATFVHPGTFIVVKIIPPRAKETIKVKKRGPRQSFFVV